MFGVAGEGGDGDLVAGGEETEGVAVQQRLVDGVAVGVVADGAAFTHGRPLSLRLRGRVRPGGQSRRCVA